MAEVLPPPMQSSTITMLHSRPSSADAFQGSQQYHQSSRLSQAPRSMYNGPNGGYRGTSAPVQPYAFQSTPHLRQDSRTASAPGSSNGHLSNHRQTASVSTSSSDTSSQPSTKDDSALAPRSASMIDFSPQLPDLSFASFDNQVKPSPDRYRRPAQRRLDSSSSTNTARPASLSAESGLATPTGTLNHVRQLQRQSSYDDIALSKPNQSELAKRYRRRSLNQLETSMLPNPSTPQGGADARSPLADSGSRATSTPTEIRPSSFVSVDREVQLSNGGANAMTKDESDNDGDVNKATATTTTQNEQRVNVPPRGSSDGMKRLAAPSPLSRQASEVDSPPGSAGASPTKTQTNSAAAYATGMAPSAAAQQLAAVSDKDLNKGTKSRLRRAFSFSSGKELRRAAGENSQQAARQVSGQQPQQADEDLDEEQLEIARRQEAAGIGAGIYSGQGGFAGSTDNLSISSTASSASMMLRKMGRGAKKGARSIKGLFRPKSVIGVPAADGPIQVGSSAPVEPTIGQVSMVTVEAERHNVNVNAHPDERTGGGTGFPKLQRNSLDAASEAVVSVDGSDSNSRRSIVGSDKDRAEVLAAVRKGILKRSATGSPAASPRPRPNDTGLPQVQDQAEHPLLNIPATSSPGPQFRSSSAPNVNLNGDYFGARVTVTKSIPNTPNGSIRSITFSPRIQFHDAWSATEYDRRGEIATCNRLTPMLAQQIKEELNTFKMEMEVHEQSKPHTHFF